MASARFRTRRSASTCHWAAEACVQTSQATPSRTLNVVPSPSPRLHHGSGGVMVSHGGGSDHAGPGLVQALALLLQSEHELPATSATNLVARFSGRSIQELCAMGGITLDNFTQSVAYREPPLRPPERGAGKPDSQPAPGAAGSPGRGPARFRGDGGSQRLAGGERLSTQAARAHRPCSSSHTSH